MASTKTRKHRTKCDACHGRGYFESGVGLAALQKMYPDHPLAAMNDRRWLGNVDEEDFAACEAAFLAFYRVTSHEELRRKEEARDEFPWNARLASTPEGK